MTHDYEGTILKEHCRTIVEVYIDKLWEFERKAAEVTDGENE